MLCKYAERTSKPVDLICHDVLTKGQIRNKINLFPKVKQQDIIYRLYTYKYGLLSYQPSDINNDLCAPIKIYEYLEAGLIPVSVFRNRAFTELNKKYPNLIFFLDDIYSSDTCTELHRRSADFYLQDVDLMNEKFKALVLER